MGEVSHIPGLSPGTEEEVDRYLSDLCHALNRGETEPGTQLSEMPGGPARSGIPGVQFALECALLDLEQEDTQLLFPSPFTECREGIPINGLIWMGDRDSMKMQITGKLDQGFRVLKMKVGALDLNAELEILREVRREYPAYQLEIRLDANGAWSPQEAMDHLERFGELSVHSIEQPIPPGYMEELAELCRTSPIPVALDEELLGRNPDPDWLGTIRPAYLILKPGLLGGFPLAEQWIRAAEELDIGWWATSALESAVGLSAIAQWTWVQGVDLPQGLGTGQIYRDPLTSPLRLKGDRLWYDPEKPWDLTPILRSKWK